jgi:hypothetical protein
MRPSITDEIGRLHIPPQKVVANEETNSNKLLIRGYVPLYEELK